MFIDYDHILVYTDGSVINFTDSDTSYVFVVIDGADQYLCAGFRITFWCRNIVQNRFEQWNHVVRAVIQLQDCVTIFSGSVYEWAFKLLLVSIQINKEFQYFIDDFLRSCFRTVDFIDAHDNRQFQFQSLAQYELGLWHGTFKCIYYQNYTIYHLENTLYLAAEVGMSRCVDDIDLGIFIIYGGVLGEDGNTTFAFDVVGVHDTFRNFLILTEYTTLLQQFIHKCRLAMIDMGNDRDIADVFSFLSHKYLPLQFNTFTYLMCSTLVLYHIFLKLQLLIEEKKNRKKSSSKEKCECIN